VDLGMGKEVKEGQQEGAFISFYKRKAYKH